MELLMSKSLPYSQIMSSAFIHLFMSLLCIVLRRQVSLRPFSWSCYVRPPHIKSRLPSSSDSRSCVDKAKTLGGDEGIRGILEGAYIKWLRQFWGGEELVTVQDFNSVVIRRNFTVSSFAVNTQSETTRCSSTLLLALKDQPATSFSITLIESV